MLRCLLTIACLTVTAVGCLDVGDPLYSTGTDTQTQTPDGVSGVPEGGLEYAVHIEPLFDRTGCLVCHAEGGGNANLDVTSVAGMFAGGESGPAVIACDSAGSLLYQRVEACQMPQFGPCLTPDELATIAKWIDQGAGETFVETACPNPPFP